MRQALHARLITPGTELARGHGSHDERERKNKK